MNVTIDDTVPPKDSSDFFNILPEDLQAPLTDQLFEQLAAVKHV